MRLTTSLAFCALIAAQGAIAADKPAPTPARIAPACIDVEVNGERVPAYDCLSDQLTPAEARAPRTAPSLPSERIARRPSNELGLFNQAATSQRMGNTFGTSVQPQRPPVAAPTSPIVKRP